ncbi:MAG: hypothetical protein RL557_448 [archaeon]
MERKKIDKDVKDRKDSEYSDENSEQMMEDSLERNNEMNMDSGSWEDDSSKDLDTDIEKGFGRGKLARAHHY